MEKVKKIIKILILLLLGISVIYKTYYFIDTLIIVYKPNWFGTEIYSILNFIWDLINTLFYYFIWVLCLIYFFLKNKLNNNDFIQGFRFLCILISSGLVVYSVNLIAYDINNILYGDEQIFYGDTLQSLGFTFLFVYLTLYLKKYLFKNYKINKVLVSISGLIIIIGIILNLYLKSVY